MVGLGLATWMEFYSFDGVNLVPPDMAGTFGLSQDQASWILTVYLSALLFSVPLSIWMAAHIGYLRYILGLIVVFTVASVGCAMAPNFGTLLAWRVIQGFAGGGLIMWWRASVYLIFTGPTLLLGITLISLQIALSRGDIDDWFGSPKIQLLAWISAISLILFVAWQLSPRNPTPLLYLALIRNRNMFAAILVGLCAGIILTGSIYALPEYLRNIPPRPLSAAQTGLIMCAYSLTAAAIRPSVTPAIARFGTRKAIAFAFCMLILAMLTAARLLTTGTPDIDYTIPLILYAFCLAPMLSAIGSGAVSKVPQAQQLDAVAIYMTFRQFGASLGITLVTSLLDWRETLHSERLFSALHTGAPQLQSWLETAGQIASERAGVSPFHAQQMAPGLLDEAGVRQATTLAYADAFRFMAARGVIALCGVLIMSPSPAAKK